MEIKCSHALKKEKDANVQAPILLKTVGPFQYKLIILSGYKLAVQDYIFDVTVVFAYADQ